MEDYNITHLVINWINVDKKEILVGATDNERWDYDTKDGFSGADAAAIVLVTITDDGKFAPVEEAKFHCSPGDIARKLAMSHIYELFKIAWFIKNENMSFEKARDKFFGKTLS